MPVKKESKGKISQYEELRQKNIEDNKEILSKIMAEFKEQAPGPVLGTIVKKKYTTRRSLPAGEVRRNPRRSSTRYVDPLLSPRMTRSRARRGSVSSETSSDLSSSPPEGKFTIRLGLRRRSGDSDGFIDDDEAQVTKRRKSVVIRERDDIRSPEDITEEDLKMVAEYSSGKVYDQYYGSTCHQCRQKTIDMKTICRNKTCIGVRGQFCGPCLRNRYGEDVKKALKNAEWICPPCRGNCNCSICRNRQGKSATGILIHLAQEYGYNNVSEYLDSLKK